MESGISEGDTNQHAGILAQRLFIDHDIMAALAAAEHYPFEEAQHPVMQ